MNTDLSKIWFRFGEGIKIVHKLLANSKHLLAHKAVKKEVPNTSPYCEGVAPFDSASAG